MNRNALLLLLGCMLVGGCKFSPRTGPGQFASVQLEQWPGATSGAVAEVPTSITPERQTSSELRTNGVSAQKTPLGAVPWTSVHTMNLYLEAEPRKGSADEPYTVCCNVRLHTVNNTSIPIWLFPRVTFYAEQAGDFYPLRVLEGPIGGVWGARSNSVVVSGGMSVSLPQPPRPGTWNLFAVQEHSETVYARYRKEYHKELPTIEAEGQDEFSPRMWTNRLVSNVLTVRFAAIAPADARGAENFIQALRRAGQYREEFRQRKTTRPGGEQTDADRDALDTETH